MKSLFIVLLILLVSSSVFAQDADLSIEAAEDSISSLFQKTATASEDDEKDAFNYDIIQLFSKILLQPASMNYAFPKLQKMFKEKTSDGKLRIINWNLPMTDGSFKYYGFIQYKPKDSVFLHRLREVPREPGVLIASKLSANNWIGALYYSIIPPIDSKMDYYVLLGWDGNNDFTNKKIIEVLSFDKQNKPLFGLPVIMGESGTYSRVIFEYAKRSTMALRYEASKQMITYDHLGPFKPQYTGSPEFYGPDASIDSYVYQKGAWIYKADIDARNSNKRVKKQKPKKQDDLYKE